MADYSSFREVGETYEADANDFYQSMQQVYNEIVDLNNRINDIAETIEGVNTTISESAEGVNQIAEKTACFSGGLFFCRFFVPVWVVA